jgi:hypothetical protein
MELVRELDLESEQVLDLALALVSEAQALAQVLDLASDLALALVLDSVSVPE